MATTVTRPADLIQTGKEQITDLSTVKSLQSIPSTPSWVIFVPETAPIWWTSDGTDPTTAGLPLAVGQPFEYPGDLTLLRFVQQSAGAKLKVAYFQAMG